MGPKKKKGSSVSDANKSNLSTNRAPKGAPHVQISAENERRLRRLLQNTGSSLRGSPSKTPEALSESQRKQAAKRLRNIYEKLASEGFSTSQIERALAALPAGDATMEAVLDWLCFNLPGHELPIKFSSGATSQEMEGASVQLLTASRADWVPSSIHGGISEPGLLQENVIGFRELQKEDTDEDKRSQQADWIRKYMAQQEEEQDGSGSPSMCSDNEIDWEAQADSKQGDRHHKHTRSAVDLASLASSIAAEFQAAKEAALAAKQKGDKEKQAMSGQLIRELKQEMNSLGLSDEILNISSGPHNSRGACDLKDVGCNVVKSTPCEDISENCHGSTEQSSGQETKTCETQLEAEDDLPNLFNEDSGKQDDLPESILDLQKKEKAAAWTVNGTLEKKLVAQKKKGTGKLTQEDTQRQPKAVLQQQCQKNGWEVPKYEKLSGRSNTYLYHVSIVQPASGRGKNKKGGGLITYTLPEMLPEFKSVEEAQNAVATWALFCLFPELPLYHVLLEPYRTLMLQWHMKGVETAMDKDSESARRAMFVDSFVNSVVGHESRAMPDMAELDAVIGGDRNNEELPLDYSKDNTLEEERRRSHEDAESSRLFLKFQEKAKRKSFKAMLESRAALPISVVRSELLEQIHNNEVVVVSGETGSGKTTQVPQFILEEMINHNHGASCNIVCTQPRRLAAISVAERVAAEQGDGVAGGNGSLVGYQVRLDSAWNSGTKLLFCTTGILLRRLASDRDLCGISHVIIDEVHERSVLGDFTLIILKDLIERRRTIGLFPLKVVLMSATIDARIFSQYFGNCPVVTVKGRTFPVDTLYLEDVYEMLDYRLTSDSPAAVRSNHIPPKKNRATQSLTSSSRGRQNLIQSGWGDEYALEEEPYNPMFDEELYNGYSGRTKKNLAILNEDAIDFELLEDLIVYIDQTGGSGAVLVFLPGMADIHSLVDRLAASKHFRGSSDWILPLHSSVSILEQRRAFQTPPSGIRKVVVATNIAETSITIEDVVHVIDCGKHKEIQYDPHRGMSRMVESWISQANAKQRQGRAGRVRHGHCFCLYTKQRFDKLMRPFQVPEMLRVPLMELCLQIKFLSLGNISLFLGKAMEPPKSETVESAISTLHEVGALDRQEQLTALGYHLAKLPVDVRLGKMMLYGALLGCLSPVLTVAACLSHKSPFSASREQMDAAETAKRNFVTGKESIDKHSSLSRGQQSDQLVMVDAYNSWITILKKRGSKAAYEYCKSNSLSVPILAMLRDLRSQFAILLADIGFIDLPPEGRNLRTYNIDQWVDNPQKTFNCNAHLASIVKATLCAGLYPNIAKMDEESIRSGHAGALGRRAGLASGGKVCWLDGRQEIFIHPSSINHNVSEFHHPFLVFHEKVKTSKIYIRDTTVISPYTLLLFGGSITVQHQTGRVSVDGWLGMDAPAQTAVLFKELRMALDSILQDLIKNPQGSRVGPSNEVVPSIVKLLMDEEKLQP